MNYCQCKMIRKIPEGRQIKVSWIPEKFANIGQTIKLKNDEGNWIDGWIIESVSPPEDAKFVEANARNYLKQRKASDVIFSKIQASNKEAAMSTPKADRRKTG